LVDPAVVDRVLRHGRAIAWVGRVWRIHEMIWDADDPGGSLVASGRWNRGRDMFPPSDAFPVLYTSTGAGVADWEFIRHSRRTDADEMWRRFVRAKQSWMDVQLPSVLDLRDPTSVGLQAADLLNDGVDGLLLPQAIAAAAYARGLSGILAPTATVTGQADADYNVMMFFELTGTTRIVYGFTLPVTAPRQEIVIEIRGGEQPNLGGA
jgi:hypothetical protein